MFQKYKNRLTLALTPVFLLVFAPSTAYAGVKLAEVLPIGSSHGGRGACWLVNIFKTPVNNTVGAVTELNYFFPILAGAALTVGFLAIITDAGRKILSFGIILVLAGIFIGAALKAVGVAVGSNC